MTLKIFTLKRFIFLLISVSVSILVRVLFIKFADTERINVMFRYIYSFFGVFTIKGISMVIKLLLAEYIDDYGLTLKANVGAGSNSNPGSGSASGSDSRTGPLWAHHEKGFFTHSNRSATVDDTDGRGSKGYLSYCLGYPFASNQPYATNVANALNYTRTHGRGLIGLDPNAFFLLKVLWIISVLGEMIMIWIMINFTLI